MVSAVWRNWQVIYFCYTIGNYPDVDVPSIIDLNCPVGTYSRSVSFKTPSKYSTPSYRKSPPPKGSSEYPSWVSSLGKEYPSWVEDLDITTQSTQHSKRRYLMHTAVIEALLHV